jgi:hypothetical protein
MTATQTVTLNGRTYTFTTEGADTRKNFRTLGILLNSRGKFAAYVCENIRTGHRQTMTLSGRFLAEGPQEAAALAALVA